MWIEAMNTSAGRKSIVQRYYNALFSDAPTLDDLKFDMHVSWFACEMRNKDVEPACSIHASSVG